MSAKRSCSRRRRNRQESNDAPVLSDGVVEHEPTTAAVAAESVTATSEEAVVHAEDGVAEQHLLTWNEIVNHSITRGFQNSQRLLHASGALQIENQALRRVLQEGTPGRVMSAFRSATLMEKERIRRAFRLPLTSVNPVQDDMSDTTNAVPSGSALGVQGIEFDLLLENELYNPKGECLSHVRVFNWREWDERVNAPTANGLLDERMGPVRNTDGNGNRVVCPVCAGYNNVDNYVNEKMGESNLCPGHFGHIVVPAVWNPMMQTHILHMLRSFCWHCGMLPGTDKQNLRIVQAMYATCETRIEKLAFLDAQYRHMHFCDQCSKRGSGCVACTVNVARDAHGDVVPGSESLQRCDACRTYKAFRPRVRTTMQADNAKKKLHDHLLDADNMDTVDEDTRRAMRASNYSGFPCDVLLNGYAADDFAAYRTFAQRTYGRWVDNTVLVMHGERVRAVIAQMHDDYLRLFFETSIDSVDEVRAWFRSQVPRVVPVIPNIGRPTNMGMGDDTTMRTDDLTRRYKEVVRRCEMLARNINPHHPPGNPPTLYPTDGDLYSSRRNTWFHWMPADERHIELYSEIQYYYAAVVSDTLALNYLSSMASSHGIGRSAAARRRRVANEAGNSGSDNSHKSILVSSIQHRLKGKEGRVRGNLEGKRVNNSSRSVTTPDHRASIRELHVPYSVAAGLIVSQRVCARNVHELITRAERARTGNNEQQKHVLHDGRECRDCYVCEYIPISNNTELCLYNPEKDERVRFVGRNALTYPVWQHPFVHQAGSVVERPLRTGDYVLLNRQPSLHRHSTMMHRVIVGPFSTFKLNELATTPYNADFDGDELNVHVAGCVAADAEAVELMKVSAQLFSAGNSAPVHHLKQDAATGMYLLTSPDTFLDREQISQLLMAGTRNDFQASDFRPKLRQPTIRARNADGPWRTGTHEDGRTYTYRESKGPWQMLWTGTQVAEYTLPQETARLNYRSPANFDFKTRSLNHPVRPLVIIDGTIICGRFTKAATGSNADSIHRAIYDRTGARLADSQEEVCDFIDRCAWFATAFVTMFGFGVGLGHCIPSVAVGAKIAAAAAVAEIKVAEMLRTDTALLVKDQHADRTGVIEDRIIKIEDECTNSVMTIVNENVPDTNAFSVMAKSGGKGKKENMMQIMGCLGGQRREGRRVIDSYISTTGDAGAAAAAAAANNATSEATSGGTGKRKAQATRDNLRATPSSRMLNSLQSRVSYHDPPYTYPGAAMGGFVKSSFVKGLNPKEFFLHAAASREGLIDTACKTSETGDAQRLAMKSCEDIVVLYDATVRGATNQLVSFRFGGNNYNPTHVLRKPLPFIGMSEQALARSVFYTPEDPAFAAIGADRSFILQRECELLRTMLVDLRQWSSVRNSGVDITTPNNLVNVITDTLRANNIDCTGALWMSADDERVLWDKFDPRAVAPDDCVLLVDEYCRKWRAQRPTSFLDDLTECEIRLRLCSKQVTRRLRLTTLALRAVLDAYEVALQRAQLPPGESVGAIMVQSIGQPSTQMTLNTFHQAGKNVLGVRKGVPRMKDLSQATRTVRMKGLKVTLPVREGLLISAGQRKLAAQVVAKLVLPDTLRMLDATCRDGDGRIAGVDTWVLNSAAHLQHVQHVMTAPMRHLALRRFTEHCTGIQHALAKESAKKNANDHKDILAALFADIDSFFVVTEDQEDTHHDDSLVKPVRTLHSLTSNWRIAKTKSMTPVELRGWSRDAQDAFVRANSALMAAIRPQNRLHTSVEMMCESVWRALLPVFGADAAFLVVPRSLTQEVPLAVPAGAKRPRMSSATTTKVITEIAIVALDCRAEYEHKMYEYIRLNRHLFFIDLLDAADEESAVQLSRAAMIDRQHARPAMYVNDIDNSGEREREDQLLKKKLDEISCAQMRHLFKNFVSTRLIDIIDSFTVMYLPIAVDARTGAVRVMFADTPEGLVDEAKREYDEANFIANDGERLACEMLYCDSCFDTFEVGCQREECRQARADVHDERHDDAARGCLSSWTLAFRLSRNWFARNSVATAVVHAAIERALGPFFHVFIGDDNSTDYVPMHVRVYTCQLDLALAASNKRSLMKLDEASLDDAQLLLERTKWTILNYAFSGPLHGSAVLCEEQRQQVFTNERGLETVQRTVLVSNSSDLYHMMGLRGIDARRVRSNSVHDMLKVVGVGAARMTAINEYTDVMADDGYVHRAHFALRADVQTRNGGFTPLSAAGLRSTPHDVCQSASHRETAKMFVNAALEHRINAPLVSPSATVMTANQLARNGTGSVHLLPDLHAMAHATAYPQMEPTEVIAKTFQLVSAAAPRASAGVDSEWAELLTLAAQTPHHSLTAAVSQDDDDDDENWRAMAATGAMFSPMRELGIDQMGSNFEEQSLPEPLFTDAVSDDNEDDRTGGNGTLDDELIELDSPTHDMLQQMDQVANVITPTTPIEDALLPASAETSGEKAVAHNADSDADVDDKVLIPGYSPTSPALDAGQPTAVPRYSPTSPAQDADADGQKYNPDQPGYANTKLPMRTSELAKLADLLNNTDADTSFMVTRSHKVRMY